jgi:hypothetical protein
MEWFLQGSTLSAAIRCWHSIRFVF